MNSNQQLNGMIAIRKLDGMISKDVSRWFERRLGKIRLGHVGTLDPLAEGVLPLLFGTATRLQDYLLDSDKAYEFDITLGLATESMDREGAVVAECPWEHIKEEHLHEAAASLVGSIQQVPPLYSAIKFRGKPLYEYARSGKGEQVDLAHVTRSVEVYALKLLKLDGRIATFSVTCSKGTYVRSLAVKIGEIVESCGMVSRLVRTKAAGVELPNCFTLEQVEGQWDRLSQLVLPIEGLDHGLPVWRIPHADWIARLKFGQKVVLSAEHIVVDFSKCRERSIHNRTFDVLLMDEKTGRAFGLGIVDSNRPEMVSVHMRRGLE